MIRCYNLVLFFTTGWFVSLSAQAPAPTQGGGMPSAEPAPAQNSNVAISPGVNLFESQTAQNFSEDMFDVDSDSINFEEGTFNWKGRTFNLGNSRMARARFERYLATPKMESDDEIYLGILERITDLLSLVGEEEVKDAEALKDQIFKAWQLLFVAGKYEMDGGTSLVVANQVYNVWRVRDETYNMGQAKVLLEEGIKDHQDYLVSDGWTKKKEFDKVQRKQALKDHTGKMYEGISEATFQAERMVEKQARLSALATQQAASGIQVKLQFQTQILNLLLQRRFEHCLIASAFYRYSFKGSHMNMQVGARELQEFMPMSDFSPTVETLEFIAREAKADVKIGMRTVDSLYESNELFAAMERLQETFFLGEYMPNVIGFPLDHKRKILSLYRKVREVQNLADLKDYGTLETVVESIQDIAYDFPASRILAAVRSAQRVSNLAVMGAKQSMAMEDYAKVEAQLEKATAIWPLNPAVKDFTSSMADLMNVASQSAIIFDRLMERGDYRQIYDRRTEFAAGLLQDEERSVVLKSTLERMGKIDIMIAQAEELNTQNNSYAAWEILLSARELEASDPKVARAQATLAPRVANFVAALDTAKRAEDDNKFAVSLNAYIQAQDIYPASKTSRLGLERVSKLLMGELKN